MLTVWPQDHGWLSLSSHYGHGAYIKPGTSRWSAVHADDLADLYCRLVGKMSSALVVHAAGETFTMRDLAEVVHRTLALGGEPTGISLKEALQFNPVAKALCTSHAISSELARNSLGWKPSKASILQEVEVWARTHLEKPKRRK